MTQSDECQQEHILVERRDAAVRSITEVLATPPRERHQIVDYGEQAIVRLRDCLIEHLREAQAENKAADLPHLREALNQANIALSLITGVEYPGAGIQEKPMLLALEVLKKMGV